ncbi:hypothetical protein LJ656_03590 [Paraburkholderia sp. MMS20-SJTR3]|uniref:Uncharacterized protein n=1 Tax=Paraburkholderia sejongensis TaxID=2886946 RepID=A0ABS8JP34_9BURK|nr:hypothetical protein [Paraburkholderia sp. MMS20-SJTR3]MCC8391661.1 hypothetical protein [Paraburkholderia sp. MMS20-SJTR3]
MSKSVTEIQRNMALSILTTAMTILRDDEPFDPAHTIFGDNFASVPVWGSVGTEYSFENKAFPRTQITVTVGADPDDPASDRRNVKQVPTSITIRFTPLMAGITRSALEQMFPLDVGYWIDAEGNRRYGNYMGVVPPRVLLHRYRYRASNLPTSRFPVDVELSFGDPNPQSSEKDMQKAPVFMGAFLTRDYSEKAQRHR